MRRNEEFMPMRRGREADLSPWSQPGSFGGSFFSQSPWQMMRRMHEDMDRMFSQFFGGQGGFGDLPAFGGQQATLQQWSPSVDISQNDREWCIEVDLPGVKKDDIHIQLQDGHLMLRAEMREETQPQEAPAGQAQGTQQQAGQAQGTQQAGQTQGAPSPQRQYHHRERRYGFFQRVLTLPENVNEEQISCDFRNGVLTVHLPKAEQSRPQGRRIEIGDGETRIGTGQAGTQPGATVTGIQPRTDAPRMASAQTRGVSEAELNAEEEEVPLSGAKGGESSSGQTRKKRQT